MNVGLSSRVDNVNISSRFPTFPDPPTVSLFGISSYNILLSKALFWDESHKKMGGRKSKGQQLATTAISEALSKGNAININSDNVALQNSNGKKKKLLDEASFHSTIALEAATAFSLCIDDRNGTMWKLCRVPWNDDGITLNPRRLPTNTQAR